MKNSLIHFWAVLILLTVMHLSKTSHHPFEQWCLRRESVSFIEMEPAGLARVKRKKVANDAKRLNSWVYLLRGKTNQKTVILAVSWIKWAFKIKANKKKKSPCCFLLENTCNISCWSFLGEIGLIKHPLATWMNETISIFTMFEKYSYKSVIEGNIK